MDPSARADISWLRLERQTSTELPFRFKCDEIVVLQPAAETMVVAPYVLVPGGGAAISVDLSQAPLDEYAGLQTGDWVAVLGTVRICSDSISWSDAMETKATRRGADPYVRRGRSHPTGGSEA